MHTKQLGTVSQIAAVKDLSFACAVAAIKAAGCDALSLLETDIAAKYRNARKGTGAAKEARARALASLYIDEIVKVSKDTDRPALPDEGGAHGEFAINGWKRGTVFLWMRMVNTAPCVLAQHRELEADKQHTVWVL